GGITLAYPDPGDLWHQLVTANSSLTFVWKSDLVDLPSEPDGESGEGSLMLFDPADMQEEETGQDSLERCLHSPRLRQDYLLTNLQDRRLAARLPRLDLNSRESASEQGVAILYVAFGFLRWFESADSEVEIRSPLLLVPVRLERNNIGARWRLQA